MTYRTNPRQIFVVYQYGRSVGVLLPGVSDPAAAGTEKRVTWNT